jgi:hypothetical protein
MMMHLSTNIKFLYKYIESQESNQPKTKSTIKTAAEVTEKLNQSTVTMKQKGCYSTHKNLGYSLTKKWKGKVLHCLYNTSVDRQLIVGEDTLLWLLRGDLKGETGSEIIAAEIRHCKPNIMRQKYNKQKERANAECKQFDESVERIISVCPIMAKDTYIQRHDTVCTERHCNMCKEIGGKLYNKQPYDNVPKLV